MSRFFSLPLVLATMLLSGPAVAAVQLFHFVARSDEAFFEAPAGTLVHGSFSYDGTLPPLYSEETETDRFALYDGPSISFSANILGKEYSRTATINMQDRKRVGVPLFEVEEGESGESDELEESDYFGLYYDDYFNGLGDPDIAVMSFSFQDDLAGSFNGFGLPTSFPSLTGGPGFCEPSSPDAATTCGPQASFFFIRKSGYSGFSATVLSITPASPAAVPEPTVWAMLLAGFGCVGAALRRRGTGPCLNPSAA